MSQVHTKREVVEMTLMKLFPDGQTKDKFADMREIVEEWNKIYDEQNTRNDRNKERSDWRSHFPIQKSETHHIKGKRVYYNLFPKHYRYDIIADKDKNLLTVNVKMHFYPSRTYLKRMNRLHSSDHPDKKYYPQVSDIMIKARKSVAASESMWNKHAPKGVKFKFDMVESKNEAHYSIKLSTLMGALYDKFILYMVPEDILAHEIGHMMGLDDEYSPHSNLIPVHTILQSFSSRHADRHDDYSSYKDMRCNLESMMCLRTTLYPYHYNHILGRIRPY